MPILPFDTALMILKSTRFTHRCFFTEMIRTYQTPNISPPGCAVLLADESEQWWYILDEDEEPRNQYELSSDNELAEHLIGRQIGEIVTLRSGLEDLSYKIICIQNKFVRAYQETMKEFSTRFPSDTTMSRVKIEDKDFTKIFSIVDNVTL